MTNFVTVAATGFKNASAYDEHRPTYNPEVVDAIVSNLGLSGKKNARIVDIAAGTGKFTEVLADRDEHFEIVAVEPVESMRTTLVSKNLGIRVQDGLASCLDLPDAWADAITVAQAFHWFDNEEALAEIRRVLKPGGKLALVWNIENYNQPASWTTSTEWENAIKKQIMQLPSMGPSRFRDEKWPLVFQQQAKNASPMFSTPIETASVPFTLWLKPGALCDRINTLSQVSILEGADREAFLANFNKAVQDGDGEWNDEGAIAFHGHTFYAWTSRL
ncbi:Methyltransferase type 11 [Cordyceps fumosorosea ARSEF 2679]|uniref:Methyltransferase type 11 n=1 Tax=Cordyceps fumosorosea (strain ARSEF 2679) TaxID=1081104 RepID=A0A168E7E0_CORFA|nr:Methyltransferase type 11 [Cordyceps fumosorosea ARSEF 2679]OAA73460.1 Methyltransferase type 11 [Cordyceps fumosorosea ARSEF 2679]